MTDFIDKLAAEGHLTPEQLERIGRNVAAFVKAAEEDPVFRAEAMQKLGTGFFGHIPVKKTLGTLGAVTAIGAGLGAGTDVYQAAKGSITKARDYKAMLEANPGLRKADSKQVQKHFSTLHKFNPEYASDPNVAAQFVQDSMQMERTPIEQINALVKARSDLSKAQQTEGALPIGFGSANLV